MKEKTKLLRASNFFWIPSLGLSFFFVASPSLGWSESFKLYKFDRKMSGKRLQNRRSRRSFVGLVVPAEQLSRQNAVLDGEKKNAFE